MKENELKELVMDELIITGGRHGDMPDCLTAPFAEGDLVNADDIRSRIGCEIVYLKRTHNDHDQYAIGVYTSSKKRLGFLWVNQSYAMYEWMLSHKVERVRARICRVSTRYGFMISKPLTPMKLTIRPSENVFLNMDWGMNVPKVQHCRMVDELNISMMMLEDALAENDAWNEDLKMLIEDVIEHLPYDLSTLNVIRSVRLYVMMKDSQIREVRHESDRLLYAIIHRGSPEKMSWWLNSCLTQYFNEAREGSLLRMFECANFRLEQVEELLHQAPQQLYHYYLGDKDHFATHLLYSSLPYELYARLLTLLAVWEMMTQDLPHRSNKAQKDKDDCFRNTSEFVRQKVKSVVNGYYHGAHTELALIEVALYDHGQLLRRNAHTLFLRKLMDWDIIDQMTDKDLKKLASGMAYKMHTLPAEGYMEWVGSVHENDKETCTDIGKDLGPTMPYKRKKEARADSFS